MMAAPMSAMPAAVMVKGLGMSMSSMSTAHMTRAIEPSKMKKMASAGDENVYQQLSQSSPVSSSIQKYLEGMEHLHSAHLPFCVSHVMSGMFREIGISFLQVGQNERFGLLMLSPRGTR